jgi:hypothetical protein
MNTKDTFKKYAPTTKTHAFTPRIPELQALNGQVFQTPQTVSLEYLASQLGDDLHHIRWLFQSNGLDMFDCILSGKVGEKNLGKWLTQSHIPEKITSKICAAKIAGSALTLTTRYKDFLRMADSTHFSSCLHTDSDTRYCTVILYLHKPNMFLLVNRDEQGKFKTRIVGRVTRITILEDSRALKLPIGTKIILLNRTYGVDVKVPKEIAGIPCFQQLQKQQSTDDHTVRISSILARFEIGSEKAGLNSEMNDYRFSYDDLEHRPFIQLHK